MGCGTSTSESTQSFDYSSQLTTAPRSAEEQALLNQFINLGSSQTNALNQLGQEALTGDPFALSDQAKAGINQYYDTGLDRMRLEGKDYADFLSGSRGLRMSDTPIAQQALQRYGLGLADLEGQRARDLVNYGLAGNQYRTNLGLMASQALPSGSVAAFNPLFSERMATGTQRQWGTGKTSGSQTMSPLQQVLTGTQAFSTFAGGLNSLGGGGGLFGAGKGLLP